MNSSASFLSHGINLSFSNFSPYSLNHSSPSEFIPFSFMSLGHCLCFEERVVFCEHVYFPLWKTNKNLFLFVTQQHLLPSPAYSDSQYMFVVLNDFYYKLILFIYFIFCPAVYILALLKYSSIN